MNHRPFEDWLLEDQPLSTQQERDLQRHLRDCTSCSAIAESNLALHSTRWMMPAAGFTDRYESRLERWRAQQRWRQILGTLVLVMGGLILLYALAAPAILQVLRAPADWVTTAASYLVLLVTSLRILSDVGGILLRDLPRFVSPFGWLALFLAGAGVELVWMYSMRRVARSPQGA